MSEWQPIETAPKDGTVVLLFVPESTDTDGVRVGFFSYWAAYGDWYGDESASHSLSNLYGKPTHWMPLPAPPTSQQP